MLSKMENKEVWTVVYINDEKRETFSLEQEKWVSEAWGIQEWKMRDATFIQ